jgi:hypothetical protein
MGSLRSRNPSKQLIMIGGRSQMRRSLYMATIVATQHNRLIRRHYQQLLKRGKAKMTAPVACMLLLILNTARAPHHSGYLF